MNMKKPVVSIITPAYNCANTIEKTYISIVSQSFSSWEWIVIEDCSKDNSYQVIESISTKDSRVVLLKTSKNSGAAVARNLGIEKAQGRYIAFLDADDCWDSTKLEKQLKFMNDNNYSFSYTNYRLLLKNGKTKDYCPKKNKVGYKDLLKNCDIGCLTVIYDTKVLGKRYMPLDREKREDYGLWLDLTKDGTYAYKLSEVLATYSVAANSVSSKKHKMLKYLYYVFRKHEKFGVFKSLFYLFIYSCNRIKKYYF